MLIRIDPARAVPLHEQIDAGVRAAIAAGDVADGERLPAARELARSLDVNVHTVLRAYATLRDDGLIELRRGRGAVVRADDVARRRLAVVALAQDLVAHARRHGVSDADVVRMVQEAQC
ncbi:GntR family transcriptional regulator [Conexibacter woesei]|uniref:Transcriptional regulator, GntR family n=1 Tax=Conexibacter woesei (strain DSM 14684 / CCUG 47730 / CIP 108061 / JCM 11494 / NBRC 100937 / ID131577) TaxID=469383 RepID=D3FDR4_CONWI|nr:GntR family transcriptional regulator [Conexibacter woesei]ADB49638.1 transcriptional regulator, GntR family [Conexibacter woesei DSM 14684]